MPHTYGLTATELRALRPLVTPARVQDFLNTIPIRGAGGDRCRSPRQVLREHQAHCVEGAMLAAFALRLTGRPALLMDLKANRRDYDHVVALFRERGHWGAVSHTNHAVLRYREPVYKTVRELALSYFHEYFTDDGRKNLRSYSGPFNLARFDARGWATSEKDIWYIPLALDRARHYAVVPRGVRLRRADPIEVAAGELRVWPRSRQA